MDKAIAIAPLFNCELKESFIKNSFISISNEFNNLEKSVSKIFFDYLSKLDLQLIKKNPFIVLKSEDVINDKNILIQNFENHINQFENNLWLLEDASCHVRKIFIYIEYEKVNNNGNNRYFQELIPTNNYYKNSKYDFINFTILDNDKLKKMDEITTLKTEIIKNKSFKNHITERKKANTTEYINSGSLLFNPYNSQDKISKSFNFIHNARTSSILPERITNYISFFECLFSDSAPEISHRVSERVALYLANKFDERIMIYNILKEAYGIRSKFIHGDDLNKKNDNTSSLKEISCLLDNYARITLNKILEGDYVIFNKNNKDLTQFFNELIFK